jgi:hypothetical protein
MMSDDSQTSKQQIDEFEREVTDVTEKNEDAHRRFGDILPFNSSVPSVASCSKFFCLSACLILLDVGACHPLGVAQPRADEGPPPAAPKSETLRLQVKPPLRRLSTSLPSSPRPTGSLLRRPRSRWSNPDER